jgi:hypothetical protein
MNESVAREVSARVLEVGRLLDETAALVIASSSKEEADAYKQAIGKVLGELLSEVMNPLYREHPS